MLLQFQLFTFGEFLTELGLAFHNRWQDGKGDGRLNSTEVLSTLYKNVVSNQPLGFRQRQKIVLSSVMFEQQQLLHHR